MKRLYMPAILRQRPGQGYGLSPPSFPFLPFEQSARRRRNVTECSDRGNSTVLFRLFPSSPPLIGFFMTKTVVVPAGVFQLVIL